MEITFRMYKTARISGKEIFEIEKLFIQALNYEYKDPDLVREELLNRNKSKKEKELLEDLLLKTIIVYTDEKYPNSTEYELLGVSSNIFEIFDFIKSVLPYF